jgi:predicted transcriptional regulator
MHAHEPRITRLMQRLGWTQGRMGEYLGLSQAAVSQMTHSGRESGPVSRLLDRLEREPPEQPRSPPNDAAAS